MSFKADHQTINDLKIIGTNREQDIYALFNRTRTRGGAAMLKDMLLYPRSREEEIRGRVNIIKYFKEKEINFSFLPNIFDTIEHYLSNIDERTRLSLHEDNFQRKFNNIIGSDTEYQQLNKGVLSTLVFFVELKSFLSKLDENDSAELNKDVVSIHEILGIRELEIIKDLDKIPKKLSYADTARYDKVFRFKINKEVKKLLYHVYAFDVYSAVAEVAKEQGFCFATINTGDTNSIEMYGVYHPLVPNAIGNDLLIGENSNMIFLTGANMAGKSTFMKTFSIAIYLAHVGFPVPAKKMRFSIQNGIFTTINLPDNLNLGLSHFYSEVSRVKKVAESVNRNDRLIIVFDELFRGTNVKDAYDATVAVANAFAGKRKCTFIISLPILLRRAKN
ncbi:hypothetical protein [uncultured Sunxiuqinia sp.]|uniref:MutS-related protein n=1 Tax=uncultured Sunxiuqinia sp. TaxID=1573825 RepID=UPI002AA62BBD|nr:hypothetical protein [uncultured Sunxiuqinia sp.]